MEEQNNITPWKYIKQHWKLILLVFLFPIMINALTFIPNFQVFEKPNSWTEVWAEYGGALLSAGIALVILYKQQKQNHEENEANRKQNELQNKLNLNLQINALKYQQQYNWLMEFRKSLIDLSVAWNWGAFRDISLRTMHYYSNDLSTCERTKDIIINCINQKTNQLEALNLSYRLFLTDLKNEDKTVVECLAQINLFNDMYNDALYDLKAIVLYIKHPNIERLSRQRIIEFCSICNDSNHKFSIVADSLKKYEYDFYNKYDVIINDIIEFLKKNMKGYAVPIEDLLHYEQEKIYEILKIENENK